MNNKILIGIILAIILAVTGVALARHKSTARNSASTDYGAPVNQLLQQESQYQTQGDRLKAKAMYEKIINDHPDYEKIEDVQQKLGELNMAIIFSDEQTPQTINYEVKPGDSLGKLAKTYDTTKELIKISNGLKSDVIRVGENLRIWTAPFTVLINKSQNVLILKRGEEVLKVYHVSVGKDNTTPVGTFKIATKIVNPVWFKPGGAPVPSDSPANELGARWMGFDTQPHYGIHGTIHPEMIGQPASDGCIRLTNADVEQLFDLLPRGTQVVIQN